ncbi:hypothetical protein SDC9_159764 [bioreactor metagenome]|uniref:Uncharacterized protein n=1 Tax=bioreactor metagenome TaxID=1076179 RepID=A0A645FFR4_9ZZZZ
MEQFIQGGETGFVLAVAIHDLTQQGDLFDALRNQAFRLFEDLFRRAAAFNAAAVGDDAVGTGVRTAVNNGDKAAHLFARLKIWQFDIAIHQRIAAHGGGSFFIMNIALDQKFDQRGGIRRGRKNVY